MKETLWQKAVHIVKRVLQFLLNPRLLLCFGLAWMITNGWAYLFLILGALLQLPWMVAVGGAYTALLWLPFTPEKIITIPIAIFLLRLLFPRDRATLAVLQDEYFKVKEAVLRVLAKRRVKRVAGRTARALVIGCPGSGKSCFARALRDRLGLPLVHLDMLYWRADKTTVSHAELDAALEGVLAGERWIIDGHYARTLARRVAAADTVFFLDYPTAVCLDGIRTRVGQARSDMPWTESEPDGELLALAARFRQAERKKTLRLLRRQRNKQIIIFRTRAAADRFLAALERKEQA